MSVGVTQTPGRYPDTEKLSGPRKPRVKALYILGTQTPTRFTAYKEVKKGGG